MEPTARRIRPLPPELANQIAAGEVVERPASVAKELIENSLDAGARELLVEVEEGGVRLIRVRDDGSGIDPDDLLLAVSRHATSKIASPRDLAGIVTLGFRGEALASVASVSRFRLASRPHGAESGWQVSDGEVAPCPQPAGTTVEVRDLFFNLPARRKFLRAERTEFEHLEEVVRRLALGHFETAFTLRHNGRQVFALRAAGDGPARERRVIALLGRPFLENALAIDFSAAGMRLHGWAGRPGYSRSQADAQYFFLNGRVIRDRVVSHALRQACSGWVDAGRHPAYLLYLEMDPALVDVNVHPTKHEVRFREARLVHDFLAAAWREAMARDPSAPGAVSPATGAARGEEGIRESLVAYRRFAEAATRRDDPKPPSASLPVDGQGGAEEGRGRRGARLLGVVKERFLLAETGEGDLAMVDLLRFAVAGALARMNDAFASGLMEMRPLLMPLAIDLDPRDAAVAESDLPARFGFDVSRLGETRVLVRQLPAALGEADPAAAVKALCAACRGEEEESPPVTSEVLRAVAASARPSPAEHPAWLSRLERGGAELSGYRIELNEERLAELFR